MVRHVAHVAFVLVISSLISVVPTLAQRSISDSDKVNLRGNVYYAGTNTPVENITVELRSYGEALISPQSTSSSGSFEFYHIPRGSYLLTISALGCEPVKIEEDLTLASDRGLTIYLKPRGDTNAKTMPAGASTISQHELSMPPKARDLMQLGKKKLYIDKDAQGGLTDFQQAVEIAPGYYEADYQIALAYLALGNASDAEKNFRKSIDVSHDSYGEANVGLGKILLDKGDVPAAEKALLRGVELTPTSSRGFYELGRAQFTEKKVQEAETSAEKSRSLAPDFPMVYRLLSNIHLQEKNYTALAADLDAYIKLDPDSPAGQRAKQMREQVQELIAKQSSAASQPPKP